MVCASCEWHLVLSALTCQEDLQKNETHFWIFVYDRPGPGWLVAHAQKVVNELGESLERERQREHASRTVLEGAVSKGGVVLPEVCTVRQMDERDKVQ